MAEFNQATFDKRSPVAAWQIAQVTFTAVGADLIIPHTLETPDPEQINYEVLRISGPAHVYHDGSPSRLRWGKGYIRLRCDQAPVQADILLSIAAGPIQTRPLPTTSSTIAVGNADTLDGLDSTDFARNTESFVVVSLSGALTNERKITAGANITLTDGGAGGNLTIASTAGGGTVTTTGSPASGNLAKFSGATSVTNADLTGDVTTAGGVATTLKTAAKTRAITFTIDGGGSVPSTGIKGDVSVPYACTITGVRMLADQSGSAVIDIWKDTYANYPPTGADSIVASAKPTITTATKSEDTTLTWWTTSITAGDTLRFNLDSVTTITRVVLILTVTV